MRALYWDKHLPAEEVCRLGGVSYKTLQKVFRENGIALRSMREAKALGLIQRFGALETMVAEVDALVSGGMSQKEACAAVGVWPGTYRAAKKG